MASFWNDGGQGVRGAKIPLATVGNSKNIYYANEDEQKNNNDDKEKFLLTAVDATTVSSKYGGDDSDVEQTINRLKGYLTTSEDEQEDDSFDKHLQVSIQNGSLATSIVNMPKISPSNVVKNRSNNFSDESSSINLTSKDSTSSGIKIINCDGKSTSKKKKLKNVQENGGNNNNNRTDSLKRNMQIQTENSLRSSCGGQNFAAPKIYPEPPNRHPPLLPKTSCPVGRVYSPAGQAYEEAADGGQKDSSLGRHRRRRTMQAAAPPSTSGRCSQNSCHRKSTNFDYRPLPQNAVGVPTTNDLNYDENELRRIEQRLLVRTPQHQSDLSAPVHRPVSQIYDTYETSVLEKTETGSFYVPSSSGRTSTTLSPSCRRTDMEKQQTIKQTYSLLPSACTTVPITVSPIKPQYNSGLANKKYCSPTKWKLKQVYCSWKISSYVLAAGLLFALAVICYFLSFIFPTYDNTHSTKIDKSTLSRYDPTKIGRQPNDLQQFDPKIDIFLRPLPEKFPFGDQIVADLAPNVFRRSSFYVRRDSFVQFNWTMEDASARLAVYGRQTLPPTPTQADFVEILVAAKLHATAASRKRSTNGDSYDGRKFYGRIQRSTSFTKYLREGTWYLSIFNDNEKVTTVRFSAFPSSENPSDGCKYNCHEKGVCENGRCVCSRGYTGPYCEETVCPILCSGNGIFTNGKCHCHRGWKGADCHVPSNVCESPGCNKRGFCNADGECACDAGFTGKFCEEIDCPDSTCSGRGVCSKGKCFCGYGFYGQSCEKKYNESPPIGAGQLCPSALGMVRGDEPCNGRGAYDPTTKACKCTFGYSGDKCQYTVCSLDCGNYGSCVNGQCRCEAGWTGPACRQRTCGCGDHGSCQADGTCLCESGWNGERCLLDGCGNHCHNGGKCVFDQGSWNCECRSDTFGRFCETRLEQDCSDKIDNDGDFLTDCEDSECCNHPSCRDSTLCQTVPEPHQILLRQQAVPPHASFFQKVRFLIDSDSLQHYADTSLFNESRVSVIRGRVLNEMGRVPVLGVRVTDSANPLYGFTLTRSGGWFDLLINGGGSVTLQFMRLPFLTVTKTYAIGWNEILLVDDITLAPYKLNSANENDQTVKSDFSKICDTIDQSHDIRPIIKSNWHLSTSTIIDNFDQNELSNIRIDSRSIVESRKIAGFDSDQLRLIYDSRNQPGYKSTLFFGLIGRFLPKNLVSVKLRLDLQGVRFEREFEAKENLSFVYRWDKRNVYSQKVYGLARATVGIRYFYENCSKNPVVVMERHLIDGFRSNGADLGGWNLNIHHKLDPTNGILEKGDGSVLYIDQEPLLIGNVDHQNLKIDNKFSPVALSIGKDGSLYVGTKNAIFRRTPDGSYVHLAQLEPADAAHQYYMATHPITSNLYVSLPMKRQIIRIQGTNSTSNTANPSSSNLASYPKISGMEIVAGTGDVCSTAEGAGAAATSECGDGGPAISASLNFPKGIAFDSTGNLYLADERKIRKISVDGMISTILGGRKVNNGNDDDFDSPDFQPMKCNARLSRDQIWLQWPTILSVDRSANDRLYVLDSSGGNSVIFDLDPEKPEVKLAAGIFPHCSTLKDDFAIRKRRKLGHVTGMTAGGNGDGLLYFSELDHSGSRLWKMNPKSGTSDVLAGGYSGASESRMAKNANFGLPTQLIADFNDKFYILDKKKSKIFVLFPQKPVYDTFCRCYQITDPDAKETYLFNRKGQHVATKELIADKFLYNFTYTASSSYGSLIQINFQNRHQRLKIDRSDSQSSKITLINGADQNAKTILQINRFNKMLEKISDSEDRSITEYIYDSLSNGLIVEKIDENGLKYNFSYDESGRLVGKAGPSGEFLALESKLIDGEIRSILFKNDNLMIDMMNDGRSSEIITGSSKIAIFRQTDQILVQKFNDQDQLSASLQLDSETHSLLESNQKSIFRRKITLHDEQQRQRRSDSSTRNDLNQELSNLFEIRFDNSNSKRSAQINGINVLNVEFDRNLNKDTFKDQSGQNILEVWYNSAGQITFWNPVRSQIIAAMNLTYDEQNAGKLAAIQWGSLSEFFKYDRSGRLIEFKSYRLQSHKTTKIAYHEYSNLPKTVQTPSGNQYSLAFNDHGQLESISSKTDTYRFYQFVTLNHVHLAYSNRLSNFTNFFRVSLSPDRKRLKSLIYPSGKKFAYFDRKFNRTTIDASDSENNSLKIEITKDDDHEKIKIDNKYSKIETSIACQSFLPINVEMKRIFNLDQKFSSEVAFSYQYDDQFRPKKIQINLDGITLQSIDYEYNLATGQVTRFASFKYEYFDARILCFNQHLSIETNFSPNNQPSVRKISIRNRPMIERRSLFDAQNRLVALTFKLNDNGVDRQISRSYDYDDQNRLIAYNLKIDDADQKSSIFKYDDAGNLRHTVDSVYDSDGFIVKRGDFTFEYDGLNRLIRSKSSKIDNRYFYDHENRVIGFWRSGRGLYQFWYTTTNRIAMAKSPDQSSTTFYYDPNFDWSLIGLEKGGVYYAVVDDPDGTPVFVFNFDGALVSRTVRTPTGASEGDDVGADFYLPVGFKGRFQDPDANVVVMDSGRSYDAITGRYMSLDVPGSFKIDFLDLDSLNGHIFNGNDPVNSQSATENLPLEIENWLDLIGYNLRTTPPIFPSRDLFQLLSKNRPKIDNRPKLFELNFASKSIFNGPLILKSNKIFVDSLNNKKESSEEEFLKILLNNSTYVKSDRQNRFVDYLWKPIEAFRNDFRSISYSNNNNREKDTVASESSFIGLPAFSPSYRNWTMSNTDENGKNILIWTDLSAINLRYGH